MDHIGAAFGGLVFTSAYLQSLVVNAQDVRLVASLGFMMALEVLRLSLFLFKRQACAKLKWLSLAIYIGHLAFCWAAMRDMPPAPVVDMYQKPGGRYKHMLVCSFSTSMNQSLLWPYYSSRLIFMLGFLHGVFRWMAYRLLVPDPAVLFLQLHLSVVLLPWLVCHLIKPLVASTPAVDQAQQPTTPAAVEEPSTSVRSPYKPYRSIARQQHRVHVKLPDPLQPQHMNKAAADILTKAVVEGFSKNGLAVNLVATTVRKGCVLLSLELLSLSQPHIDDDQQAGSQVLQHVGHVLPHVMTAVTSGMAGPSDDCHHDQAVLQHEMSREGGPTMMTYVQMGNQRLAVSVKVADQVWRTSAQKLELIGVGDAATAPELGLVLVVPGSRVSSQQPVTAVSSSSRAPRSVSGLCGADEVCWLLQVQLWDEEGAQAGQWRVQGSDPAVHPSPTAADDLQPAGESACALQLWALGGTGYLRTHVMSCVRASKQAGQDTGCMILEVVVCASRDQLLCHHHGGPPVVVQPVCLQLWRGDYWLHSSHSLLCVGQVSQGGELVQDSCSWWGASPAATCACVEELQALTHRLWHTGAAREEVVGQQLLLRDVTYWLSAVQLAAYEQDWCVCKAANAPAQYQTSAEHTLTLFTEAGQAARTYSTQVGLQHTTHLIDALSTLVSRASATHPSPHSLHHSNHATGVLARLQSCAAQTQQRLPALAGFPCPACEHLYCSRAGTYLHSLRACGSIMVILISLTAVWRQQDALALTVSWLALSWSACHAVLLLLLPLGPRAAAAHRAMAVLATAVALLAISLAGWRVIPSLSVVKIQKFGVDVCGLVTTQLPNRLHLQSLLPQRHITLLALTHTAIMYTLFSTRVMRPMWYKVCGSVLAGFAIPLLMDQHVRTSVMSVEGQPTQGRPQTHQVQPAGATNTTTAGHSKDKQV